MKMTFPPQNVKTLTKVLNFEAERSLVAAVTAFIFSRRISTRRSSESIEQTQQINYWLNYFTRFCFADRKSLPPAGLGFLAWNSLLAGKLTREPRHGSPRISWHLHDLLFSINKKESSQTQMYFHQHSVRCWSYPYIATDSHLTGRIKNKKPLIFNIKQRSASPVGLHKVLTYKER